jgi:hypothetical protein
VPTAGSTLCRRLEKHDGVTRDCLAPADGPDLFTGLCLDVYGRFFDTEQPPQIGTDCRFVSSKLRLLGMDDDIAIDGPPSSLVDPVDDCREQSRAVQAAPLGIGIREELANVTQTGRSQESVGHSVANDVRIGVSQEPEWMIDLDSTKNQSPSHDQPVRVVPDPNPHVQAPSAARGPTHAHYPYKRPSDSSVFRVAWLSRHAI